jgi:hypothetical protein
VLLAGAAIRAAARLVEHNIEREDDPRALRARELALEVGRT